MQSSFLSPGWASKLAVPLRSDEFKNMIVPLLKDPKTLPGRHQVFKAFQIGDFADVKVVIVGQDPYYHPGVATGLAFAVDDDNIDKPKTLVNILKEVQASVGKTIDFASSSLVGWAQQGVFLYNVALTVERGRPLSHISEWEWFSIAVLRALALDPRPKVFMLWGKAARDLKQWLPQTTPHLILEASHPSPQSARMGQMTMQFHCCRHFSRANEFLVQNGQTPIKWEQIE